MSNIYILRPMATHIDSLKGAKFFSNYDAMMESFGPRTMFTSVIPSNEGRNGWLQALVEENDQPIIRQYYWRRIKVTD